jgi:hypothetical protein
MDRINLAQNRKRFHKTRGISRLAEEMTGSQKSLLRAISYMLQ